VNLRGAEVYLGGVDDQVVARLPWHVWTRGRPSYLGCMWSLSFEGGSQVDLVSPARDVAVRGEVQTGCTPMPADCTLATCSNGGVCSQIWDAPVCDCSATAFTGTRCQQGALCMCFTIHQLGTKGDDDDDDEGRINFSVTLSPKTTRTRNNKPKQ